ncbi:MAG: 50S ribosomal protein L29 [Deltaproteobacteria bacterium]|nr:50S ribosomal protein L29 [Deltaproteobacteria bacterium]
MKVNEELAQLRGLSMDELVERISSLKEELMRLRFRQASGQLDNTSQLSLLKRRIARAMTVLRQAEVVRLADSVEAAV